MRCRLATTLTLLSLPASASAQLLTPGQRVDAELTAADAAFGNGAHYRIYAYSAQAGDPLSIALSSDHFDANLVLLDVAGARVAADDDTGGACNALINTRIPTTGDYQVVVFAGSPGTVGRFALTLNNRPAQPGSTEPCTGFVTPTGVLEVGEVANDSLATSDPALPNGNNYDMWLIPLPGDGSVSIDLEADSFDPYLTLLTPRGDPIGQNDNGAGGCNARVVYQGTDGQLRALIRARRGRGPYRLTVRRGSLPINYRDECGGRLPEGRTIAGFSELEAGHRVMEINGAYLGALTESDAVFAQDQTRVQAWAIQGKDGDVVTIELVSSEFDPFLMVFGPGLPSALSDDDGADGCNARLTFTLRSDEPYSVIVNHAGASDQGNFELYTSTETPSDPTNEVCSAAGSPAVIENLGGLSDVELSGHIPAENEVTGTLDAADALHSTGTFVEAWTVTGEAGRTATVTLRSDDFDSFLYVMGPGIQGALRDDDSAGGCDARITITFPQTAEYRVILTSVVPGTTGRYRASFGPRPEPPNPASCGGDR